MSLLSVVMPTYNRANVLKGNLENIDRLSRDLPIEFIVVDDGSKDGTKDVLIEAAKSMPNLRWLSVENGGQGRARNLGAERARGDIVQFIGDDIHPLSPAFFTTHLKAHERFPDLSAAVLGKVIWPDRKDEVCNFVMSHIQGKGGEQFSYAAFKPYSWLDWRHFYTCNVSMKRAAVRNWANDGFSHHFRAYGWEDVELAYRLGKQLGRFDILYCPQSVGEHHHPHTMNSFLNRQTTVGITAKIMVELHPELKSLLIGDVVNDFESPDRRVELEGLLPHYAAMVEGIKSWGVVLEANHNLGSQNWHDAFLSALFRLAFDQGVVTACDDPKANLAAAYQGIIRRFYHGVSGSLETELLGRELTSILPPIGLEFGGLPTHRTSSGLANRLRQRTRQVPFARPIYRACRNFLARCF